MNKYILLLCLLLGCNGAPEQPPAEYRPPFWEEDPGIATVISKLAINDREDSCEVLLRIMRNYVEREYSSLEDHLRKLDQLITQNEYQLSQAIEEYENLPLKHEDGLLEYYANVRIRIELLKIQQIHHTDLLKVLLSIKRLKESLPIE